MAGALYTDSLTNRSNVTARAFSQPALPARLCASPAKIEIAHRIEVEHKFQKCEWELDGEVNASS